MLAAAWLPWLDHSARGQSDSPRPNILWISAEDHGLEMGCYGDPYAVTPNVDALARRGLLYRHAWSTAPVCAPARTTIISGIYPPSLGAEHMRSMMPMPPGTQMFPTFLREQGYYCTNNRKEDYNLVAPDDLWDESSGRAHYKNRAEGQPFFAIFNSTVSHESAIRNFKGDPDHDPAEARVPAYHPDTPTVRRDWAIFYDTVTKADAIAGEQLRELEEAGLSDSTIVFYWSDHGSGMPRSKRWPSQSGLGVALVVYIPEAFADLRPDDYISGGQTDRPVGFIDFAPTMLSLAGIEPPEWMQGHAFLGRYAQPKPPYMYGFRGRMDERVDLVRTVSDGRYVYLRNYMPHLSQGQHVSYQMQTPTTRQWRQMYDAGELNEAQSIFWKVPKDPEELYDLHNDPDEVNNLAESAEHREVLQQMREAHRQQTMRIRDVGFIEEGQRYRMTRQMTPYELGHDDQLYPLEQVFEAAELASMITDNSPQTLQRLAKLTAEENSVLRYWGALGLRMRGAAGVTSAAETLAGLLDDPSPSVRVVAAEALANHGDAPAQAAAIDALFALADWSHSDVFTSIAALAALETLGDRLPTLAERIEALPDEGTSPHGRYSSYVPRLVQRLNTLAAGQ